MRHSLRGSMVILGSTISATRCLPCFKPSLFHFSPRNLHFRLSSSPVRSNYSFLHSLPNQHQTDLSFVTKASTEEGHVSVLDNKSSDFSASVSCSTIPLKNGETIDVNPPRGTRDFLPEDMQFRNWLFQKFREVSRLFAFEEVDFPLLEAEALYVRKGGEEITKQLYNFEDKGGRRVALRPELTPSLARVIMQKGNTLLPIKWFAIGQCWRYERTTRGRRREHYQWNMDIMGISGMEAEAELISAIVTFFVKVGITSSDVVIKVSSRKVLQEVLDRYLISRDVFTAVCIIVDKIEKMPAEDIIKELTAIGITADTAALILQNLSLKSIDDLEELLGSDSEAVMELKDLFSYAAHYGYSDWLCFDASVVRGLAYYTGIVFEGFDRSRKLRAICGGGRYDQLLSTFGGDDVPACGFGFGDAVIVELLKEKNLMPNLSREIDDIVWPLSRELRQAAAMVTSTLRKKGYNVDLILEDKKSKWVFKYAEKINAKRLIIVGDEEWKRGAIRVKNLCTREQSDILLTDLS